MQRLRVFWLFVLCEWVLMMSLRPPWSAPALAQVRSPLSMPIRTVAPVELPDTLFTDRFGRAVHLRDLRGRVTLIAFSNVRCVEQSACVNPVAEYAAVKSALGMRAHDVAFVFVGVDPRADAPVALNAYLGADADLLGWNAETAVLRALTLRFGVHMNEADGILLAHAPFVYLLDEQVRLRVFVPKEAHRDELIAEVRALLDHVW